MIRTLVIGAALLVVAAGGLVFAGVPLPGIGLVSPAPQAAATGRAGSGDAEAGAPAGGFLGRVAKLVRPGDAKRAEAESTATRVYYQYVDGNGQIHFAQNLSQVPVPLRQKARSIEMKQPKPKRAPRAAAQAAASPAKRPFAYKAAPAVVVYTAPWCGWCRKTLAHLDGKGVDYQNKDIEADPANRQELVRKTGTTSIPVVEIGGELIRGHNPARMDQLLN